MYYHSDRIPQDICDAYKESVRQDKKALEEEEKQNAKKALEERVRQMIIEKEQDEFFKQLHAREEDAEQDAVLQGTRRFKRLCLGEDTMHTYIPIPIQSIPRGGYFTLDVAGPTFQKSGKRKYVMVSQESKWSVLVDAREVHTQPSVVLA